MDDEQNIVQNVYKQVVTHCWLQNSFGHQWVLKAVDAGAARNEGEKMLQPTRIVR